MNDNKQHLLICTVGTPEPVLASIRHWSPARVHLIYSEKSRSAAGAVRDGSHAVPRGAWDETEIHDAEDFGGCVRTMRRLEQRVREWQRGAPDQDIIVDFTGGTKCMTAALALVSRRWVCTFSYVGGASRTENGTGTVRTGTEQTFVTQNPWDSLGYQAVEDACLLFDQGAFSSAANLLVKARDAADDGSVKRPLVTLHQICDGYNAWDRFDHSKARTHLNNALKNATDLASALGDNRADSVIRAVRAHLDFLGKIHPSGFSHPLISDLLGNARRRKTEGRYDDAVARLYRAIESVAQLALEERHGIADTGEVPLKVVPKSLAGRWATRAEQGKLKLGLQDAYELLGALEDRLGTMFEDLGLRGAKSPLIARNNSILAHGFTHVSPNGFDSLWSAALTLADLAEEDLPVFPILSPEQGSSSWS